MNILKMSSIIIGLWLIVLSIGTVAYSQNTEQKTKISKNKLISDLQDQIEQLQTIIKTQKEEIRRLKALCEKAGIDTKRKTKQKNNQGNIAELYHKYKDKYALLDGKYIFFPNFDLKFANSRKGKSYPTDYPYSSKKLWFMELPEWAIGEYGLAGWGRGPFMVNQLTIFQVLGPDEMLVKRLLGPEEMIANHLLQPSRQSDYGLQSKLVRFKGWSTKNFIDGQRWVGDKRRPDDSNGECIGVDIAVVGTYRYRTASGASKTILDVVPLELFRKGITLEQFKEMLKTKRDLPDELRELRAGLLR